MFALVGEALALHQARNDGDPFAAIGVARIMLGKADTCLVELRPVPGVDEVDREPAAADVLDAQRQLRQHNRMIKIRLDGSDDLDPARQCRDCGRRAPCLELIEIFLMGIDRVLRDQCRVVTEPFRRQHKVAIALP